MRTRRKGKKLGRPSSHRLAMLHNLVSSLITHGRIKTTVDRAKEASRMVEKMITMAKKDDVHHRRLVAKSITQKHVLKKLFEKISPDYKERMGGYTRVLRLGPRHGDGAEMALLEFVQGPGQVEEEEEVKAKDKKEVKAEKKSEEKKKKHASKKEEKAKKEEK